MASLFESRGVWYVSYMRNHRRVRKSLGTRDETVARKALKRWNARLELEKAGLEAPGSLPREVVEEYLAERPARYSETDWPSRRQRLRRFLDWYPGQNLARVGKRDLVAFRDHLRTEKLTAATANRHFVCLSALYEWAIERDYLDQNPVRQLRREREHPKLGAVIDRGTAARLLVSSRGTPFEGMVATALYAGLRRREMVYLAWKDVDLKAGLVYVRRGKGGKQRVVPIHAKLREVLERIPRQGPWCFPVPIGEQKPDNLQRPWYRWLRENRFPKIGWHTLRRTFATMLTEAHSDPRDIQEILGHSDFKVTERYAHWTPRADSLDRLEYGEEAG